MGKQIVLCGAGHAHLRTILNLKTFVDAGHSVTVVNNSDFHYYSGMGPGLISGLYKEQDARVHVRRMVESSGGRFICSSVYGIDPAKNMIHLLESGTIPYDVVSFNVGSEVPTLPAAGETQPIFTVKPIENLIRARDILIRMPVSKHLRIAVIGGGAAGVEIAGNLWRLLYDNGADFSIAIVSAGPLLAKFTDRVRELAMKSLSNRNISVIEDSVTLAKPGSILLGSGTEMHIDIVFNATGTRPPSIFRDSGLATGNIGGLLVNRFLQCADHQEIFGGGDCVEFGPEKLPMAGVYAVRMGDILLQNLRTYAEGRELREFVPQKNYLLVLNMGDGTGVIARKNCTGIGRYALFLKKKIDRSYMNRYQISGERSEA